MRHSHHEVRVMLGFLLLCGMGAPTTGLAKPLFRTAIVYRTTGYTDYLAVSDVNGDGNQDILVPQSNAIAVFLGKGDGLLQPRVDYPNGASPRGIAVADLNDDGIQDLISSNASNSVSVLLGLGGGQFGAKTDFATGGNSPRVVAGDLNSDGKPDLATVTAQGAIAILIGAGDGTFGPHSDLNTGGQSSTISIGDLNGDGKLDLVGTRITGAQYVFLGNGDGTFGAGQVQLTGATSTFDGCVAEMNGDGIPDLLSLNYMASGFGVGHGAVSVRLGNGDGTFQTAVLYDAGDKSTSIAVGDMDGDGDADVVLANRGAGPVSILRGGGDGSLLAPVTYGGGAGWGLALADMNGDGALDAVTTADYWVRTMLGRGDATFQEEPLLVTQGQNWSMAVGDLNGDGEADLASSASNEPLTTRLGNGDGSFGSPLSYPLGPRAYAMTMGNFNGDGSADLAQATDSENEVAILPGDGSGGLGEAANLGVGSGPRSLVAGDFNADGILDLVSSNLVSSSVSVLIGLGGGVYAPHTDYAVGASPYGVSTGDLNGDGVADLVTANWLGDNVSVLPGNEDGTFGPRVDLPAGTDPVAVRVADVNGDGSADLVAANVSDALVWLGHGDMTFDAPMLFAASGGIDMVLADLDLDGRTDIAMSTQQGGVAVLLGVGDGTFGTAVEYGDQGISRCLVATDLNGDGGLDLLVGHDNKRISVLLNTTVRTLAVEPVRAGVSGIAMRAAFPNPSQGLVSIRFAVASKRQLKVEIFSATGRRVRTLVDGAIMPAGEHGLSWDGRYDAGSEAQAGVYFLKISGGGDKGTARLALLR